MPDALEAGIGGARNAPEIDAPMLFKSRVFGGDERVAEDFGEIVIGIDDPPLEGERTDDAPLVVVELGNGERTLPLQLADFRQVGYLFLLTQPQDVEDFRRNFKGARQFGGFGLFLERVRFFTEHQQTLLNEAKVATK